jgi:hypothetical protein
MICLTLLVAGSTLRSQRAVASLRRIAERERGGACELAVVDVLGGREAAVGAVDRVGTGIPGVRPGRGRRAPPEPRDAVEERG